MGERLFQHFFLQPSHWEADLYLLKVYIFVSEDKRSLAVIAGTLKKHTEQRAIGRYQGGCELLSLLNNVLAFHDCPRQK